jgi:hypothetical protein
MWLYERNVGRWRDVVGASVSGQARTYPIAKAAPRKAAHCELCAQIASPPRMGGCNSSSLAISHGFLIIP